MSAASLSSQPPIVDGVILSRFGDVHEREATNTRCGLNPVTAGVRVTPVQAQVHKLPLCKHCYPSYYAHGKAS